MTIERTNYTKTISLTLSADLYRRIRILAAKEEKSGQQWMREALALVAERMEARDAR